MHLRACVALVLITGCAGAGRDAKGPTTSLRIRGGPADATVTVDDEILGPLALVAQRGVALPAGTHRVTVTAPGYFPADREVAAAEGGTPIVIDVRLVRVPE